MWPNPQETADLVTFTEQILNGKLHFLCSDGIVLEILTNSSDFRRDSGFFKDVFKFWNFKSPSFCVRHHLHHYVQLLEYMLKTTVRVY